MPQNILIKRTTGADKDFQDLIIILDNELWNELGEDQSTYDQYNIVSHIQTALVVYVDDQPAAIGCYKPFDETSVEIKRMFVRKEYRGLHLSKMVLNELELWAKENGYLYAVLETSIHFKPARNLYQKSGYTVIPNYGQYTDLEESVCMKKSFQFQSA